MHLLPHTVFLLAVLAAPASAADAWLEAGVPATSRTWQGADYMAAAAALSAESVPLPRYADADGARVLERVSALENFSFHRNRTLPIQSRLEDYLQLQEGANAVLKRYVTETTATGERFNAELASLVAFLLHASSLGMELVDEFVPTLPRDDTYATRMEGMARMSSGLATVFVGAETTLRELHYYTQEDLSRVLSAMAASLPRIAPILPADFRQEMYGRLAAHRAVFVEPADLENLETMLRILAAGS